MTQLEVHNGPIAREDLSWMIRVGHTVWHFWVSLTSFDILYAAEK